MDDNDLNPGHTAHDTQPDLAGVDFSADTHTTNGTHNGPGVGGDLPPGQTSSATHQPSARGVRELIAAEAGAHPGWDAARVAERVVELIADDWRRQVFPLIVAEAEHQRRHGVAAAEKPVVAAVRELSAGRDKSRRRQVTVTMGDSKDDLLLFVSILDRPVSTYAGGPQIAWGDMTVAQHRTRAARLDLHIAGTAATRDLHLAAVAACETRGADTLRSALRAAA